LILGFLGILGILRDRKTRFIGVILLGWWLVPLLVQAVIAKVFTARYILFSVGPVILLAGFGLWVVFNFNKIKNLTHNPLTRNWLIALTVVLALLPSLYFDWRLWQNPARAPLPEGDLGYIEGWTSGWGIKEVANYLKNLPRDKNIIVGTEGFFGTLPEGLQIYLEKEKGITVIGIGYPIKTIPGPLTNAKEAGDRVYLVVNESRLKIDENGLRLVEEYLKPGGDKLLFLEIQ
jgi:4-amino-4-deoxy-L-arabinose transferase-like glycosyltransferase